MKRLKLTPDPESWSRGQAGEHTRPGAQPEARTLAHRRTCGLQHRCPSDQSGQRTQWEEGVTGLKLLLSVAANCRMQSYC